jgi:mono/diheme cytochrome c family protein
MSIFDSRQHLKTTNVEQTSVCPAVGQAEAYPTTQLKHTRSIFIVIWLALCLGLVTGCALTMRDQPRYEAFEQSTFFEDNASARPQVEDTVARGQLRADAHLYTGQLNNDFAPTFPFTVTQATLERGRERYNIFCSPCHGLAGDGHGTVVEYGFKMPPSFHDPELRAEPAGYYFDLITRGTRVMPSYAARIQPEDRWAIVAYIRALQLSQSADLSQVPPDEVPNLDQTEVITK